MCRIITQCFPKDTKHNGAISNKIGTPGMWSGIGIIQEIKDEKIDNISLEKSKKFGKS